MRPIDSPYPHLLAPFALGSVELPSRLFIPAHQNNFTPESVPNERLVEYMRVQASGGAALIVTGSTSVVPEQRIEGLLANVDDEIVPGYQRLADAVHGEGARLIAQFAHNGPGGTWRDAPVVGPSRTFPEKNREFAREISGGEIERVVEAFGAAARRAYEGGLDGVELNARGGLLGAFLSRAFNRRDDEWGGSQGRTRLVLELLRAVREGFRGAGIVGLRIGADERIPGGNGVEEAIEIARAISAAADFISITAGTGLDREGWAAGMPGAGTPFAANRTEARAVKHAVPELPVLCVGRVNDLELAEQIVADGDADMVGMVRAHIADPAIIRKSVTGRVADVRPCVGANLCLNLLYEHRPIRCIGNPVTGFEHVGEARQVEPDEEARRVVVVGAGPGGLEAARVLGMRGHQVVLIERDDVVGGQMARWTATGSRAEYQRLITWWQHALSSTGNVELRLGAEADADAVRALEPDAVVLATGSRPTPLDVQHAGATCTVVDVWDALRAPGADHAVVLDDMGRMDAALVAERLAASCGRVTLVTSRLHVCEGEGNLTLYPMLRRLREAGVELVERARAVAVDGTDVHLEGVFGGPPATVSQVDLVTAWQGAVPVDALAAELDMPVELIGDAHAPRRVEDAVRDGWLVGRTLLRAPDAGPELVPEPIVP